MSPRRGLDASTVIHTAAEIADTHGFDAVTLATLAKELGIRSPSLYNHVSGLADLQRRLAVHGLERLLEAMTHAAVGRSEDDAIRSMSGAYRQFALGRPGLYEATLRGQDLGDLDVQGIADRIVDLVVQVLGAYDLNDDEAIHAVRGLRSILHGFASLEKSGQFGLPIDVDTSFQRLVDTFLAGIKAQNS